jgi:tetratricopeptide (TPR) repeat protein
MRGKITVANNDSKYFLELGLKHHENNEFHKAIIYYEKSLEFEHNNIDTMYRLGYCYFRVKEFQKQKVLLEKLLQLTPSDEKDIRKSLAEVEFELTCPIELKPEIIRLAKRWGCYAFEAWEKYKRLNSA